MTHTRTVIVHPEWGIYLGSCMGLGFFSALDNAGQTTSVTFSSETDARDYVQTWDENGNPHTFSYHTLECAADMYATIDELDTAGLSAWTGSMKEEATRA